MTFLIHLCYCYNINGFFLGAHMNKKLEEYQKKANKIVKTFKLLGILIFILGVLISIVQYTLNRSRSDEEAQNAQNGETDYIIDIENGCVIYNNSFDFNLNIKNYEVESNYKIIINIDNKKIIEQENIDEQNKFTIKLDDEGPRVLNIVIYKNNEENYNKDFTIYYIEKYQKQFLDELSKTSVQVHYIDGTWEKYEPSIDLISYCGFKNIKSSFLWNGIEKNEGEYDFSYYDEWITKANELGIKVFACVNRVREWRRKR